MVESNSYETVKRSSRRMRLKLRSACNVYVVGEDMCIHSTVTSVSFRSVVENQHRPLLLRQKLSLPQQRDFYDVRLSEGALKIMNTPNAGGNSVRSEVLSYEVLRRCFGAELLKTEMEIEYFPYGSKKTDYAIQLFGQVVGVSVTRAMHYKGPQNFTQENARALLAKKLDGIIWSTQNLSSKERFSRQILHVWAEAPCVAEAVGKEYRRLKSCLRKNTVVLVTVIEDARWLFFEKSGDMLNRRI